MSHWQIWKGVRRWLATHPGRPIRPAPAPGRPVIGLALSGGFARGMAHIGVLKVLEENRIPIDAISGSSVGSVIGGAYASGTTLMEMEEKASSIRFHDFGRWTVSRMGLASNARMEQLLRRCFRKTTFEELGIPLAIVATDITNGEPVVFRSGDLLEPVRASCAYPALFLPVKIGGRMLIDGAFSAPVPVQPLLEMGVTHVIAVNLESHPFPAPVPTNLFQMIGQCFSLLQTRGGGTWREQARCVIEPKVVGFGWDDFEAAPQLIAAGEEATRAMLPKIQEWLQPRLAPVLAFSR